MPALTAEKLTFVKLTLPAFVVDRATCLSRLILVETIACYLEKGAVVQIEDSTRPRRMQFYYEIRPGEAASHLFDARGRQIGVFASVAALVDYAETVIRGEVAKHGLPIGLDATDHGK